MLSFAFIFVIDIVSSSSERGSDGLFGLVDVSPKWRIGRELLQSAQYKALRK